MEIDPEQWTCVMSEIDRLQDLIEQAAAELELIKPEFATWLRTRAAD